MMNDRKFDLILQQMIQTNGRLANLKIELENITTMVDGQKNWRIKFERGLA